MFPTEIEFYGKLYSDIDVNNNGDLTFGGTIFSYFSGLSMSQSPTAIIAPFQGDVDTINPGAGTVGYSFTTLDGYQVFEVTWHAVSDFEVNGQTNLLKDTFQVLLVSRPDLGPEDIEIIFNYQSILWDTGEATGTIPATVGYSDGRSDNKYYQLPGSQVGGSFLDGGPDALDTGTNHGVLPSSYVPGQYVFLSDGINVTSLPEPSTIMLLPLGLLALIGWNTKRTSAGAGCLGNGAGEGNGTRDPKYLYNRAIKSALLNDRTRIRQSTGRTPNPMIQAQSTRCGMVAVKRILVIGSTGRPGGQGRESQR